MTIMIPGNCSAEPGRRGTASSERPDVRLEAVWARSQEEIRSAQRLRWRVFADEMGARLSPPPGTPRDCDADEFDEHCEHLIVRTIADDGRAPEVVGTYRVLTPGAAGRAGSLYTDREFDLGPLAGLRPRIAELGRSCIAAEWRSGGVVLMLWSSLAEFMLRNDLSVMIGCASVPMRDGGHVAASLWRRLRQTHLAPPDHRVVPHLALPIDSLNSSLDVETPALIKGYLKCGAKVLGPPAWDPDFGSADLPMMLRLEDVPVSYRRRFLAAA